MLGFCVRTCAALVSLTILVAFVLSLLIGTNLDLPGWARERIAARIDRVLDGLTINFGDIALVVNEGLRPRVSLRDVVIRDTDGVTVLQLSDLRASLAMRPLLRGQVQPKSIALNGGRATIRRHPDGTFALLLENEAAAVEGASNAGGLVEAVDDVFLRPAFSALTEVSMSDLTLSYVDGRSSRHWTADGGSLLLRRADNALRVNSHFTVLSGGATAATVEMNYDSVLGSSEAAFGVRIQELSARDVASQSVALGWLTVLDAPLSGALRGSIDGDTNLGEINATLQIGQGSLQPTDGTRPIPFDGAQAYIRYDPDHQNVTFDQLSVKSPWISGAIEGHAYVTQVTAGRLREMNGQFSFRDLKINPIGAYAEPLALNATTDLRIELDPFRLTLGQLYISEGDSQFWLKGQLDAEPNGWRLAVDAQADQITPERVVELWPSVLAPKPRVWVDQNMHDGLIYDVDFALRRAPEAQPSIYGDFRYSDMSIRFLKSMPPIRGASGQATLADNRLVTTTESGMIDAVEGGTVEVAGTSFIIPDLTIKPLTPAIARVRAAGSATSFLSLLDQPPLNVMSKAGLPVDLADGAVAATGTISFPMAPRVEFDQISFHVSGQIEGAETSILVPDHVLRAKDLSLYADQGEIRIGGSGTFSGVPGDFNWRQPIGKPEPQVGSVTGSIEVSEQLLDVLEVDLPPGSVSGQSEAEFSLTLGGGEPPSLTARSDLQGVGLALPEVGWRKRPNSTGRFELEAQLGPTPEISRISLNAAGLRAEGRIDLDPEQSGRDVTRLSRVSIGDWLNTSVTLAGRGPGLPPNLSISGGRLNLDDAPFGKSGAGDGGTIKVALDRLEISDGLSLTNFRGEFQNNAGLKGPFTGKVNGGAAVTGTVAPYGSGVEIRIRSADAGGVLRSAGIIREGHGGDLDMRLIPGKDGDRFEGTMRITNLRIKDGPAIAALLNAISIVGLLDEMAGQGILFTEVEARFGITPKGITIYQSSAVGPSIGASMDGMINVQSGRLNLQGAVTPVYFLNQVGGALTRKGEGLFSFSYRLEGTVDDPQVRVNPLSVLAPGTIRDVFRKPAPVDPNAPKRRTRPRPPTAEER